MAYKLSIGDLEDAIDKLEKSNILIEYINRRLETTKNIVKRDIGINIDDIAIKVNREKYIKYASKVKSGSKFKVLENEEEKQGLSELIKYIEEKIDSISNLNSPELLSGIGLMGIGLSSGGGSLAIDTINGRGMSGSGTSTSSKNAGSSESSSLPGIEITNNPLHFEDKSLMGGGVSSSKGSMPLASNAQASSNSGSNTASDNKESNVNSGTVKGEPEPVAMMGTAGAAAIANGTSGVSNNNESESHKTKRDGSKMTGMGYDGPVSEEYIEWKKEHEAAIAGEEAIKEYDEYEAKLEREEYRVTNNQIQNSQLSKELKEYSQLFFDKKMHSKIDEILLLVQCDYGLTAFDKIDSLINGKKECQTVEEITDYLYGTEEDDQYGIKSECFYSVEMIARLLRLNNDEYNQLLNANPDEIVSKESFIEFCTRKNNNESEINEKNSSWLTQDLYNTKLQLSGKRRELKQQRDTLYLDIITSSLAASGEYYTLDDGMFEYINEEGYEINDRVILLNNMVIFPRNENWTSDNINHFCRAMGEVHGVDVTGTTNFEFFYSNYIDEIASYSGYEFVNLEEFNDHFDIGFMNTEFAGNVSIAVFTEKTAEIDYFWFYDHLFASGFSAYVNNGSELKELNSLSKHEMVECIKIAFKDRYDGSIDTETLAVVYAYMTPEERQAYYVKFRDHGKEEAYKYIQLMYDTKYGSMYENGIEDSGEDTYIEKYVLTLPELDTIDSSETSSKKSSEKAPQTFKDEYIDKIRYMYKKGIDISEVSMSIENQNLYNFFVNNDVIDGQNRVLEYSYTETVKSQCKFLMGLENRGMMNQGDLKHVRDDYDYFSDSYTPVYEREPDYPKTVSQFFTEGYPSEGIKTELISIFFDIDYKTLVNKYGDEVDSSEFLGIITSIFGVNDNSSMNVSIYKSSSLCYNDIKGVNGAAQQASYDAKMAISLLKHVPNERIANAGSSKNDSKNTSGEVYPWTGKQKQEYYYNLYAPNKYLGQIYTVVDGADLSNKVGRQIVENAHRFPSYFEAKFNSKNVANLNDPNIDRSITIGQIGTDIQTIRHEFWDQVIGNNWPWEFIDIHYIKIFDYLTDKYPEINGLTNIEKVDLILSGLGAYGYELAVPYVYMNETEKNTFEFYYDQDPEKAYNYLRDLYYGKYCQVYGTDLGLKVLRENGLDGSLGSLIGMHWQGIINGVDLWADRASAYINRDGNMTFNYYEEAIIIKVLSSGFTADDLKEGMSFDDFESYLKQEGIKIEGGVAERLEELKGKKFKLSNLDALYIMGDISLVEYETYLVVIQDPTYIDFVKNNSGSIKRAYKTVYQAGEGVGNMAMSVSVTTFGAVTGLSSIGIGSFVFGLLSSGAMYLSIGGGEYIDLINQGVDDEVAWTTSNNVAIVDTVSEIIFGLDYGMPHLLPRGSGLGGWLTNTLYEGLQEKAQSWLDTYTEYKGAGKALPDDFSEWEMQSNEEMVIGWLVAGEMGAPHLIISTAVNGTYDFDFNEIADIVTENNITTPEQLIQHIEDNYINDENLEHLTVLEELSYIERSFKAWGDEDAVVKENGKVFIRGKEVKSYEIHDRYLEVSRINESKGIIIEAISEVKAPDIKTDQTEVISDKKIEDVEVIGDEDADLKTDQVEEIKEEETDVVEKEAKPLESDVKETPGNNANNQSDKKFSLFGIVANDIRNLFIKFSSGGIFGTIGARQGFISQNRGMVQYHIVDQNFVNYLNSKLNLKLQGDTVDINTKGIYDYYLPYLNELYNGNDNLINQHLAGVMNNTDIRIESVEYKELLKRTMDRYQLNEKDTRIILDSINTTQGICPNADFANQIFSDFILRYGEEEAARLIKKYFGFEMKVDGHLNTNEMMVWVWMALNDETFFTKDSNGDRSLKPSKLKNGYLKSKQFTLADAKGINPSRIDSINQFFAENGLDLRIEADVWGYNVDENFGYNNKNADGSPSSVKYNETTTLNSQEAVNKFLDELQQKRESNGRLSLSFLNPNTELISLSVGGQNQVIGEIHITSVLGVGEYNGQRGIVVLSWAGEFFISGENLVGNPFFISSYSFNFTGEVNQNLDLKTRTNETVVDEDVKPLQADYNDTYGRSLELGFDYSKLADQIVRETPGDNKGTMISILENGGVGNYSLATGEVNMSNPGIDMRRRLGMAALLLNNPTTFNHLAQNGINVFHGTNSNALASIIQNGLLSHQKSESTGVFANTGEVESRFNGPRNFVSYTDDIATADAYANAANNSGFPVIVGTTYSDATSTNKSFRPGTSVIEFGVRDGMSSEGVKVLMVPQSEVGYVESMVGNKDITVLPYEFNLNKEIFPGADSFFGTTCNIGLATETFNRTGNLTETKTSPKKFGIKSVAKSILGRGLSKK